MTFSKKRSGNVKNPSCTLLTYCICANRMPALKLAVRDIAWHCIEILSDIAFEIPSFQQKKLLSNQGGILVKTSILFVQIWYSKWISMHNDLQICEWMIGVANSTYCFVS